MGMDIPGRYTGMGIVGTGKDTLFCTWYHTCTHTCQTHTHCDGFVTCVFYFHYIYIYIYFIYISFFHYLFNKQHSSHHHHTHKQLQRQPSPPQQWPQCMATTSTITIYIQHHNDDHLLYTITTTLYQNSHQHH